MLPVCPTLTNISALGSLLRGGCSDAGPPQPEAQAKAQWGWCPFPLLRLPPVQRQVRLTHDTEVLLSSRLVLLKPTAFIFRAVNRWQRSLEQLSFLYWPQCSLWPAKELGFSTGFCLSPQAPALSSAGSPLPANLRPLISLEGLFLPVTCPPSPK